MSTEERVARPELHWAFWTGLAGALAAAALSVKGILASASSTAALGFVFVPFVAIAAALPAGIWGLALGVVVAEIRGKRRSVRAVLIMAWVVSLAVPAVLAWQLRQGLALEREVHALAPLDGPALDARFAASPWNRDKFFLGALAQHNAASASLLERIAALDDPDLYEPMGSLWDVMGENRKGLAVMRLVAAHANASAATLERLATGAQRDKVLHDVLRNPNTPLRLMAPHYESTDYLVEWALALNPNTPQAVLQRLSRSANLHTRINLTYNRSTPVGILERLAKDPDASLARNAGHALERRRREAANGRSAPRRRGRRIARRRGRRCRPHRGSVVAHGRAGNTVALGVHALLIAVVVAHLRAAAGRIGGARAGDRSADEADARAGCRAPVSVDDRACERADRRADGRALHAAVDRGFLGGRAELACGVLAAVVVVEAELVEVLAAAWQHERARSCRYRSAGAEQYERRNRCEAKAHAGQFPGGVGETRCQPPAHCCTYG